MKKLAFFYAPTWDRNSIEVAFEKRSEDWEVPIGSAMLNLPDDLVPSENVWNSMVQNHKLERAKMKVTACEVALGKAKDELKSMLAIESNVFEFD